jgi:hypothetical protein
VSALGVLTSVGHQKPYIVCSICNLPGADQETTLEYIHSTILKLSRRHANAQLLICGDFNRLPIDELATQFGLSNVVNFNTRGDAIMLDLILTDIPSYTFCDKLAPIANNDHCCILLRGEGNLPSRYVKRQKRLVIHPRKLLVLKELAEQS